MPAQTVPHYSNMEIVGIIRPAKISNEFVGRSSKDGLAQHNAVTLEFDTSLLFIVTAFTQTWTVSPLSTERSSTWLASLCVNVLFPSAGSPSRRGFFMWLRCRGPPTPNICRCSSLFVTRADTRRPQSAAWNLTKMRLSLICMCEICFRYPHHLTKGAFSDDSCLPLLIRMRAVNSSREYVSDCMDHLSHTPVALVRRHLVKAETSGRRLDSECCWTALKGLYAMTTPTWMRLTLIMSLGLGAQTTSWWPLGHEWVVWYCTDLGLDGNRNNLTFRCVFLHLSSCQSLLVGACSSGAVALRFL